MSGLAALLAGRKPAGVYHWSSPMRVSDIRHAAEHCGWRCVVLDTISAVDAGGFHDAVAAGFELPDSYGRSLDALADVLRGTPDAASTVLVWEGWASLASADPDFARRVIDVLTDRTGHEPAFAVVVHGPGSGLNLVELDRRPEMPR